MSELAERTVDWLETELQGCVAGMGALHARALELIGELSDRKAHVDDGHRHMGDWLVMKFDLARDTAFRWAKVADQLRALPAMSTAYATGELSFDQTRLLAKLATPENEEELLADFGGFSVFSLELWTRKQRERSEKTPTHTEIHVREADANGVGKLWGHLVGDDGEAIIAAIRRESDKLWRERVDSVDDLGRDSSIRNGEALARICGRTIAEDHDPDRAQIVVHVPWEAWTHLDDDDWEPPFGIDLAEYQSGAVVTSETLRRLSCDCRLQVVCDDGGRPVGLSSPQRTAPPHLSRLIRRRDRQCRFPGCGSRWVHVHHIWHWTRGGPTQWSNLVALCPYHHKLVHEGGWTITGNVDATLTYTSPGGNRVFTSDPPARAA